MRVYEHLLVRWISVLAFTATTMLSSTAMVLCVGSDGRATVEVAHQDSGCQHHHTLPGDRTDSDVMHHCHSSCTDSSLPQVLTTGPKHGRSLADFDLVDMSVLAVFHWKPTPVVVPTQRYAPPDPYHDRQVGRALNSTILLI